MVEDGGCREAQLGKPTFEVQFHLVLALGGKVLVLCEAVIVELHHPRALVQMVPDQAEI